jgi:hypothetical protein
MTLRRIFDILLEDLGLRRRKVYMEWARFTPVRELNATVYHRCSGWSYCDAGPALCCGEIMAISKSHCWFLSAMQRATPCAKCQEAYEAAGTPQTATRVEY